MSTASGKQKLTAPLTSHLMRIMGQHFSGFDRIQSFGGRGGGERISPVLFEDIVSINGFHQQKVAGSQHIGHDINAK